MMNLSNNRLNVQIAEPASLYRGTRFDWTGFITQVTLDKRHTFCAVESKIAGDGTGGVGLCNEFGIFKPIGFDEAQPGESFLKPGVGLLVRPDDAKYNFERLYDFTTFQISTTYRPDAVHYVVHPAPCRGYAMQLEKTVRIEDNWLHIEYVLENVGERRLQTHEYNHNFLAINGAPLGPEYSLQTPIAFSSTRFSSVLNVHGSQVTWNKTPKRAFYHKENVASGADGRTPALWQLSHKTSGASVREVGDYSLAMFALWGTTHVVSPETFVAIDVQPGATQKWARRYEFSEL